jgi:hypothetical protein
MSMTTPYCEKHEWPGGMDRPCPDCDELAKLHAEVERLKLCEDRMKYFAAEADKLTRDLIKSDLQVRALQNVAEAAKSALGCCDYGCEKFQGCDHKNCCGHDAEVIQALCAAGYTDKPFGPQILLPDGSASPADLMSGFRALQHPITLGPGVFVKQKCACKCHNYVDHNGKAIVCGCCLSASGQQGLCKASAPFGQHGGVVVCGKTLPCPLHWKA